MAADRGQDEDDPFAESSDERTPEGGVGSVIYYQDADGRPARKSKAVRAEIVELNEEGEQIFRFYMEMNRGR